VLAQVRRGQAAAGQVEPLDIELEQLAVVGP
jgi:hypothetical protein